MDNTNNSNDIKPKMGRPRTRRPRGRPRKGADLRYPHRLETKAMVERNSERLNSDIGIQESQMTMVESNSPENDSRPIILSEHSTADRHVQEQQLSSDAEIPNAPDPIRYHCNGCSALLQREIDERHCPKCGSRLHWDRVKV